MYRIVSSLLNLLTSTSYLGHVNSNELNDKLYKLIFVILPLVGQINNVLCFLGNLDASDFLASDRVDQKG